MISTIRKHLLDRPVAASFLLRSAVAVCLFSFGLYAQEFTSPLIAGQTTIEGSVPAAATGIEVQVNQAAAKMVSVSVGGGAFTVKLDSALEGGQKVRARAYTNGTPGEWSSETTVFRQAAAASATPALSFTPSRLDFDSQPWGVASSDKTITVKNTSKSNVPFVPRIIDSGQLTGSASDSSSFQLSPTPDCQNPLPADASCTLHIVYKPSGSFDSARAGVLINGAGPLGSGTGAQSGKGMMPGHAEDTDKGRTQTFESLLGIVEIKAQDINSVTPKAASKSADQAKNLVPGQAGPQTYLDALNALVQAYPLSTVPLTGKPEHWKFPFTRGVAGIDLSAPSSQTVKQAYFVEFNLLAPVGHGFWNSDGQESDPLDSRFWVWFNPRITSLPQSLQMSADGATRHRNFTPRSPDVYLRSCRASRDATTVGTSFAKSSPGQAEKFM